MRNSSTSRHRNQVKQVFSFDFIRKGYNFEWKNLRDHIFVSDDTFQIFSWCPDLVGVISVKPQKIELFLAPKYVWRIFSVCRNWIIKRRKGCTALIFSWPSCVFAGSWKSFAAASRNQSMKMFFSRSIRMKVFIHGGCWFWCSVVIPLVFWRWAFFPIEAVKQSAPLGSS